MKKRRFFTEHGLLFFISVMLGTLLVTMLSKEKYPENTMMSKLVATDILTKGWNKQELLIYCLMKRIKEFGVLFLFSCTVFRKLCFGISTILIGVGLGILLKLFFLWYGANGIILLLVALIPQYIFYWMGYGLIYWNREICYMRETQKLIRFIPVLGVVIIGCIVESYVNPFLVSSYLNLFMHLK